jgi:hypothetical protein
MSKWFAYILRFGPLVAAFALGLAALISIWVPSYTGILNQALSVLSLIGVRPDVALVAELGNAVAGIIALIGVARKVWALIKPYFFPVA